MTAVLHPTQREVEAFCEVLDTVAEWVQGAALPHEAEAEVLRATRTLVAFPSTDVQRRHLETSKRVHPPDAAAHPALVELRWALQLVAGAAYQIGKVPAETFRGWERLLLTHAANAGAALGIADAAKRARVALDSGKRTGRRTDRFPEPDFARQLALGRVLAQYRDLGKLTQADLARLVQNYLPPTVKFTAAKLGQMEAGRLWKGAPVPRVAECLGQSPEDVQVRAEAAHRFAAQMARTLGVRDPVRWFAEVVAVDGEETARAYLQVAASAAVRLDLGRLRQTPSEPAGG